MPHRRSLSPPHHSQPYPSIKMSAAYLVLQLPCLSCSAATARAPASSSSTFLNEPRIWSSFLHPLRGARLPSSRSTVFLKRRRSQSSRGRELVVCVSFYAPQVVTASTWDAFVLQSDLPVLVEFWATWCGPCKMVYRIMDEIAPEYAGRIRVYRLNTDDYSHIASSNDIEKIPTVLLFKNGEKIKSITGTLPKSVYVEAIEQVLSR